MSTKKPPKKRPLTAEEKQMAAVMKAAIAANPDLTEESVGAQVGVSQGQISHWTGGRLPVPSGRAIKLASALGIDDPSSISVAYRELQLQAARGESIGHEMRPDLEIARLQNDVESMRRVIAVMATVMMSHRPAEGASVVRALKKHVPVKFVRQGFVHELLATLEKGEAAASRETAQPGAKRPA